MSARISQRLALFCMLLSLTPLAADPPKPGDKSKKIPAPKAPEVEIRLADNSTVKGVLLDDKIEVVTRYGKLSVPAGDVQRIDFGPRPSAEEVKKIEAAITELASASEKQRETAVSDLIALRELAFPALTRASHGSNDELAARVREVMTRLREALGEERLGHIRDEDVIQTDGFTIVGRIESSVLRARTNHFGELQLKVADLRGVRSGNLPVADAGPMNVEADPGGLTNHEAQIGKTFYFRVTGAANGSLWGTEVFTTDSTLAAAAVHSGLLKIGQTGVVKVTMLPSPPAFAGSTQNGLTSSNYGAYRAAYKVSKP